MTAPRPKIVEAEREVLRALCGGVAGKSMRSEGIEILGNYRFEDDFHQVVFDALRELATKDAALLRELLPARLNNKGFPDVDLDPLFQPLGWTEAEAFIRFLALRAQAGR